MSLNLRPSTYVPLKKNLILERNRNSNLTESTLCQKAVEKSTGFTSYSIQQRQMEHQQKRGNVR
jgi:hypothetical protein